MNNQFTTLSIACNALKEMGYVANFSALESIQISIEKGATKYKPEEVIINEYHRFEGESNPADTSIVYAIEAKDGTKGLLIDSYGADSSIPIDQFIKKVQINNQ
jgi:hypothetical protein